MNGKNGSKSVTERGGKKRTRAKHRCPPELEGAINLVNSIAATPPEQVPDDVYRAFMSLCRIFHEMAQLANMPADMREDYAKAVVGTPEEWKKFQDRMGVP